MSLKESRGFLSMLERKGRSARLCRGDEDRKGMGTDRGKSGMKGCISVCMQEFADQCNLELFKNRAIAILCNTMYLQ